MDAREIKVDDEDEDEEEAPSESSGIFSASEASPALTMGNRHGR